MMFVITEMINLVVNATSTELADNGFVGIYNNMLASVHEYMETFIISAIDYTVHQTKYVLEKMERHPVSEHIEFYNGSAYGVVVSRRNGVSFISRPPNGHKGKEFVIVVTYEVGCHFVDRFANELEKSHRFSNAETQVYLDNVKRQQLAGMGRRSGNAKVSIHYLIEIDRLLAAKENCLYIENLDMVLSLDSIGKVPPHPFANMNLRPLNMTYRKDAIKTNECIYHVRIVDNNDEFGGRFINTNGTVLRINACKDNLAQSGVYVRLSNQSNINDSATPTIIQNYYSFEEAETKLSLFRTREEARTLGDIALS